MPPRSPAKLGIVTGLAAEVRCLPPDHHARVGTVRCAGADPDRAADAAAQLIAGGACGLVSFGLAGGLDPALPAGTLVLADAVVSRSGQIIATDQCWRERLQGAVEGRLKVALGRLLSVETPLTTAAAKRDAAAAMGAIAVDMESVAIAGVAAAHGVPALIIRSIADPAARSLPHWLDGVIKPNGRPDLLRVLKGLAGHPFSLPRLLALARDQEAGLATLRRVALLGGPFFQFDR